MRRVWMLGWLMMLAACREKAPAQGAVRVSVSYGSYRPACLRVRVWDAQGHEGHTDITQGQFKNPAQQQVLVAVFREAAWEQALNLEVSSFAAATGEECSGDPVEVRATSEPLQVLPKTFVPFEVALQAKDDDGDTFIARAEGVGGSDCDDGRPEVHPGAPEQCALNVDDNCDGAKGCQDAECQGQSCDDGNVCTTGDLCQGAGVTAKCAGQPKQCVKSSACVTDSTCSQTTGECVETRKSCTTPPATAVCAQSTGVCLDATGECAYASKPANTSCDDNTVCTTQDVCNSQGACQGTPTSCTPSSPCVTVSGSCPAANDCVETADSSKVGAACTLSGSSETGVCRAVDGKCSRFPFTPRNFDPDAVTTASLVPLTTTCAVTFDSTTMTWDHPECVATPRPTPTKIAATTSAPMVLFTLSGLTLGKDLRLVGDSSVILAVYGDASLENSILAQGMDQTPGAGGNIARGCPLNRRGANGSSSADGVASGGGGAGGATPGGAGGSGSLPNSVGGGGGGGAGSSIFAPLAGGCVGGDGGGAAALVGPGGAGGGAVQVSVSGTLTVKKFISASGGGGHGGRFSENNGGAVGGGGGGGSGGQVLLEANQLNLEPSSALTANGGAGGEGSGYLDPNPNNKKNGSDGSDGAVSSSAQAVGGTNNSQAGGEGGLGGALDKAPGTGSPGTNPSLSKGGGGGGGGAVGYIKLRSVKTCSIKPGIVISPDTDRACPLLTQ